MILEVCWDGLWTLSFGLSQFHSHGSWLVCELTVSCHKEDCLYEICNSFCTGCVYMPSSTHKKLKEKPIIFFLYKIASFTMEFVTFPFPLSLEIVVEVHDQHLHFIISSLIFILEGPVFRSIYIIMMFLHQRGCTQCKACRFLFRTSVGKQRNN